VFFTVPVTSGPTVTPASYQVSGRWLVWLTFRGGPLIADSTATLRSFDAMTGRYGPRVSVRSDLASPTNGRVPDVDERSVMENLVITTNGNYAWLVRGSPETRGGPPLDAIYAPDGNGGDQRIDTGAPNTITHLHARGHVVSWLNAGHRKTVVLPLSR
jgi:hypothetical protein